MPTDNEINLFFAMRAVLSQDREGIVRVFEHPNTLLLSLQVMFLAVLSETVGQSVVLFANRIKFGRFVFSLLLTVVIYMVDMALYTSFAWFIGGIVLDRQQPLSLLFSVVALGHTPLVFAAFGFLPYLGLPILRVLRVFTYALIVTSITTLLDVPVWQTFLLVGVAYGITEVSKSTVGLPVVWTMKRFRRWLTGTDFQSELQAILPTLRADQEGDDRV